MIGFGRKLWTGTSASVSKMCPPPDPGKCNCGNNCDLAPRLRRGTRCGGRFGTRARAGPLRAAFAHDLRILLQQARQPGGRRGRGADDFPERVPQPAARRRTRAGAGLADEDRQPRDPEPEAGCLATPSSRDASRPGDPARRRPCARARRRRADRSRPRARLDAGATAARPTAARMARPQLPRDPGGTRPLAGGSRGVALPRAPIPRLRTGTTAPAAHETASRLRSGRAAHGRKGPPDRRRQLPARRHVDRSDRDGCGSDGSRPSVSEAACTQPGVGRGAPGYRARRSPHRSCRRAPPHCSYGAGRHDRVAPWGTTNRASCGVLVPGGADRRAKRGRAACTPRAAHFRGDAGGRSVVLGGSVGCVAHSSCDAADGGAAHRSSAASVGPAGCSFLGASIGCAGCGRYARRIARPVGECARSHRPDAPQRVAAARRK